MLTMDSLDQNSTQTWLASCDFHVKRIWEIYIYLWEGKKMCVSGDQRREVENKSDLETTRLNIKTANVAESDFTLTESFPESATTWT